LLLGIALLGRVFLAALNACGSQQYVAHSFSPACSSHPMCVCVFVCYVIFLCCCRQVALKASPLKEMAGGLGEFSLASLTPEKIASAGGQAEPFTLSNDVTMYIDAVGALKRLPINPRAADLADRCGYGMGVAFHGDVYLGRLDRGAVGGARNIDFTVADVRGPSAKWVQTAHAENMARQQAEGGRSGGVSAEELASRGGEGEGYKWTQNPEEVRSRSTRKKTSRSHRSHHVGVDRVMRAACVVCPCIVLALVRSFRCVFCVSATLRCNMLHAFTTRTHATRTRTRTHTNTPCLQPRSLAGRGVSSSTARHKEQGGEGQVRRIEARRGCRRRRAHLVDLVWQGRS
jgi:hypothetical protein